MDSYKNNNIIIGYSEPIDKETLSSENYERISIPINYLKKCISNDLEFIDSSKLSYSNNLVEKFILSIYSLDYLNNNQSHP